MGYYINPGNENFKEIRNDEYIDKSGLISVINSTIGTKKRLSCVSRPRRFGKSYAANMLEAYYDCGCDSHGLFDDLEIAKAPDYEKHLNQYNVLYLDITGFMSDTTLEGLPAFIRKEVVEDMGRVFPDMKQEDTIKKCLNSIVENTGRKFIAIIDEWDAPVRDPYSTEKTKKDYLEFLRSLFKSEITKKVFAAAYMTGILPVRKDGTQSAISEFAEYTIIKPGPFAPYAGFLEEEVKGVCARHGVPFEEMKGWYDGYTLYGRAGERVSVYNPNSVMKAADCGEFESYWGMSSAVYGALDYINMDFDGLGEAAERLTAGLEVPVRTAEFRNDMTIFGSADDVLTLLLHFGYLTLVREEKNVCRIPNREIMEEFAGMIHRVSHRETIERLKESEQFLADVIAGDTAAVAANIQKVHMKESAPLWYNGEQALRAVIKLAFFTYRDHYIRLEELPSGTGYADMAYIPKKYDPSPAMVVELKAGGTPEEALEQMRSRNYASSLEGLGGELLLVAVTYEKDDKAKPHHCLIEKYKKSGLK
ncbi:MAG: AAA family ATPase [Lachnospiraceae bacterium]|nr:AAA family ATPase [Lachnospiraceae bacterium]